MKKYIHVTRKDRQFLAKAFGVSDVTIWKALRYEQDTETIRKIQKLAKDRGGIVMAVVPEVETFWDCDGYLRQYLQNGALVEINKKDGSGDVIFKGNNVRHWENLHFRDIEGIQSWAMTLR